MSAIELAFRPLKLLVVEDDDGDVRLIRRALASEPLLELGVARDGSAALLHLTADPPDLVLLDLNIPGPSGFDILEWMAANLGHVPVLVLTGSTNEIDRQRVLDLGARTMLRKPRDRKEFSDLVRSVFDLWLRTFAET